MASTGEPIRISMSGCKAPRTAEEADPGRWWVQAEGGRCPITVDVRAIPTMRKRRSHK
jgi:hypothetical protein